MGCGAVGSWHSTAMFELADHPELVDSFQSPDTSSRSSSEMIYMFR